MQRYIVTEKATGKELLNFEFTKADEAVAKIRKLFAVGTKPDEISVRMEEDGGLPPVVLADKQVKAMVKVRKTRSDAGKPHDMKVPKPISKRVRNRGQFFICNIIKVCGTKEELFREIDTMPVASNDSPRLGVVLGHEVKAVRQYTLKPVKEGK